MKTPLVEKQIPQQAKTHAIPEEDGVNNIMLAGTAEHQFTSVEDLAEVAFLFAALPTNALSGQSLIVRRGLAHGVIYSSRPLAISARFSNT